MEGDRPVNTMLASLPADLKEENRKTVLQAFHDSGQLTTVEVAERTGISRQTVKKCIDYYAGIGVLCSCGKGKSSKAGGKRPELFTLNDKLQLVCVLIHHHEIVLKLIDLHYNTLGEWNSGLMRIDCLDTLWEQVRLGKEALLCKGLRPELLAAVCLAAPIALDAKGGVRVATPYPYWPQSDFGRPIDEPLKEIFPTARKVWVTGDGPAAGYALLLQDPQLRRKGRLLTFYSSTGIGGAAFRNGELDASLNGTVSTLGHLTVAPEDPEPCPCGGHGCLERMVCRKRMRERLAMQEEAYQESCLGQTPISQVTFAQLFEGARKGDRFCRRESVYYADMFAVALRNAMILYGPEVVIFEGDFGQADETFRQELINRLSEYKYLSGLDNFRIEYDTHDLTHQETVGTAYFMIMDYLKHPEEYVSGMEQVLSDAQKGE